MKIPTIAACLVLTGCAAATRTGEPASQTGEPASQTGEPASQTGERASRTGAAVSSTVPEAAEATEITAQLEVDAFRREEEAVVCKREAPVGSRIPITRCYPRTTALNDQQQHELEEMRRQRQLLLEQQRMQSAMGARP